jgi:hypothetical protein
LKDKKAQLGMDWQVRFKNLVSLESQAARIAIESADTLDKRLENFPQTLLEEIYAYNHRWVVRALHYGKHLDDIDAALKS